VFLVRSVYFNLRNIIPKSGTFLPGHPVYVFVLCGWQRVDSVVYTWVCTGRISAFIGEKTKFFSYGHVAVDLTNATADSTRILVGCT